MAISLPAPGQHPWATELNAALTQLDQQTVVDIDLDGSGDLIFTKNNGTSENLGNITATSDAALTLVGEDPGSDFRGVLTELIDAGDNGVLTELDGKSRIGLFAARPAANAVRPGTYYSATDVPETYRSDGTNWRLISGGGMVAYAESTVPITNNSATTGVDVPGLIATFVAGVNPLRVAFGVRLTLSVTTSVMDVSVLLDNVVVARINHVNGYGEIWETKYWERQLPPLTPGTVHVVKVQFNRNTAGTGIARVGAEANNPNTLEVRAV